MVFATLLALINWVCGIYLKRSDKKYSREQLPNYQDNNELAKKIFHDYNSVQHQYEPFVGWRCKPYKGETLTVNAEGYRHTPGEPTPDTSKVIRFFGGSTMWGEGADDANTIPALFIRNNPGYKAINHGQLAYNSRQELDALISTYAKGEKTDIVVFYDGVNDAAFLCPREITDLPAHRLVPMYRDKLYSGNSKLIKELTAKVFVSNILTLINTRSERSQATSPYDCVSNPAKAEAIAEMMFKNWELAHEIVTNRGGKFIAVLQPAAFVGKPRVDHLSLDADLGSNFVEIYKRLQQKISERKHPWIYDLSDKFDGDEFIYIDFCHVSPNGNRIVAAELSKIVSKTEREAQ